MPQGPVSTPPLRRLESNPPEPEGCARREVKFRADHPLGVTYLTGGRDLIEGP